MLFSRLRRHKQTDAFSIPGPHGYPVRFAVRPAGPKGFKIYGPNSKEPLQYIECHTRQLVLHRSGHKADKSPALATIQSNWPSWSIRSVNAKAPAFTITLHSNDGPASPDSGSSEATGNENTTVNLTRTLSHPVTFQFSHPIPTTTAGDTPADTVLQTFQWRRAPPACHETRSIRKRTLPLTRTGDARPPEERFVYAPSGSILVRLKNTTTNNNNNQTPVTPAGTNMNGNQLIGYTSQGEEIVASYTNSRDFLGHARVYFQFWGSGATGVLGEAFTRVAVLSGLAVWLDEEDEKGRGRRSGRVREEHGLAPEIGLGVPGKEATLRVHLVKHGRHAPGHMAVETCALRG